MTRHITTALAALVLAACASPQPPAFVADDPSLHELAADRLEPFANEHELLGYVRDVRREARRRGMYWAALGTPYALLEPPPKCEDPTGVDCPKSDNVIVTAQKRSAPTSSITNNQKGGVDEGDIVKQSGRFLVVLQDGRLFTIDTGKDGGGLALADRADVYRSAEDNAWYDEMLIEGRRIVVLGYSYRHAASEFSVFTLDDAGKLTRQGVFLLSSGDYYDVSNYATRLVDGQLVIYTPLDLTSVDPDRPMQWPVLRRWTDEKSWRRDAARGRRLFDAAHVYRPMQATLQPTIHAVSVCPLDGVGDARQLECSSTAVIGPPMREFFVSPTDAYLWISPGYDERPEVRFWDNCPNSDLQAFGAAAPSGLYRLPLSGKPPRMLHVRGQPSNQFGLDTADGEFRALLVWGLRSCGGDKVETEQAASLKYFHIGLGAFRDGAPGTPDRSAYVDVPGVTTDLLENRFTDTHLVYAGRETWGYGPPEAADAPPKSTPVVVVPVKTPKRHAVLQAPHTIIRAERTGERITLTGYRDAQGLSVSQVAFDETPALSDTLVLKGRYESEGRSHAFNSQIAPDGSGLMGVPTVHDDRQGGRWRWRSEQSDVSFLAADANGRLSPAGVLEASDARTATDPAYQCEVSCVDWYGNTRPIFIGPRIFGLSGTELIEGVLAEGRVAEVRRLNLTAPPKR